MSTALDHLRKGFRSIGAELKFEPMVPNARHRDTSYELDVRPDRHRRDIFILRVAPTALLDAHVLHVRFRRHTAAFQRQGEWFFVPTPSMVFGQVSVHRNEPLSRGAGKPHWAEELARAGGQTVYVCARHPTGVSQDRYRAFLKARPDASTWGWRRQLADAHAYVRGRIRHPDHATLVLPGWHRVHLSNESAAPGRARLVFLD